MAPETSKYNYYLFLGRNFFYSLPRDISVLKSISLCLTFALFFFLFHPLKAGSVTSKKEVFTYAKLPTYSLYSGEIEVEVTSHPLYKLEDFIFKVKIIFQQIDSASYKFLVRSEGINHKGISISLFDGHKFYSIQDKKNMIFTEESSWEELKTYFESQPLVYSLLRQKGKTTEHDLRLNDTIINGIRYRYSLKSKDSVQVKIAFIGALDENGNKILSGGKALNYFDTTEQILLREENYTFVEKDTMKTIAILKYFHESEFPRNIQKIFDDTLYMYTTKFGAPVATPKNIEKNAEIFDYNNKYFPHITITSSNNSELTIYDLPKSVILLDFSYNSCMPCHLAIPALKKLQRTFGDRGLSIVGINPQDNFKEIQAASMRDTITYPIYSIEKEKLKSIGIHGYPTFILIDRERKIRMISSGYSNSLYDELSNAIIPYLDGR